MKRKIILATTLYFLTSISLYILSLDRSSLISTNPSIAYFIRSALYGIIIYILLHDSSDTCIHGSHFWTILIITSLLVLLIPLVNFSPQLTAYLLSSHFEIFLGLLIGFSFHNLTKK